MMQMSDTHPERRRVRHVFKAWRAEGEVQLTPESNQKLTAAQFLEVMGRHRFVLSPRGNGVDAHRTWEARRMCSHRTCMCMLCCVRVHVHVACGPLFAYRDCRLSWRSAVGEIARTHPMLPARMA